MYLIELIQYSDLNCQMGGEHSDLTSQTFKRQDWLSYSNGNKEDILWRSIRDPSFIIQQYPLFEFNHKQFKHEKQMYFLRKNNPSLVAAHFLENHQNQAFCATHYKQSIFLQYIPIRLQDIEHIPFPDYLHLYHQCLKGFSELANAVGCFMVDEGLVGINQRGVVKVWMNECYFRSYIWGNRIMEEIMVRNVVEMIDKNIDHSLLPANLPSVKNFMYRNNDTLRFDSAISEFREFVQLYHKGVLPDRLECIDKVGGIQVIMNRELQSRNQLVQLVPQGFNFNQFAAQSQDSLLNENLADNQYNNNGQQRYSMPVSQPRQIPVAQERESHFGYQVNQMRRDVHAYRSPIKTATQILPTNQRERQIVSPHTIRQNVAIVRRSEMAVSPQHQTYIVQPNIQFPPPQMSGINSLKGSQIIRKNVSPSQMMRPSNVFSPNNAIINRPSMQSPGRGQSQFLPPQIIQFQSQINNQPNKINQLPFTPTSSQPFSPQSSSVFKGPNYFSSQTVNSNNSRPSQIMNQFPQIVGQIPVQNIHRVSHQGGSFPQVQTFQQVPSSIPHAPYSPRVVKTIPHTVEVIPGRVSIIQKLTPDVVESSLISKSQQVSQNSTNKNIVHVEHTITQNSMAKPKQTVRSPHTPRFLQNIHQSIQNVQSQEAIVQNQEINKQEVMAIGGNQSVISEHQDQPIEERRVSEHTQLSKQTQKLMENQQSAVSQPISHSNHNYKQEQQIELKQYNLAQQQQVRQQRLISHQINQTTNQQQLPRPISNPNDIRTANEYKNIQNMNNQLQSVLKERIQSNSHSPAQEHFSEQHHQTYISTNQQQIEEEVHHDADHYNFNKRAESTEEHHDADHYNFNKRAESTEEHHDADLYNLNKRAESTEEHHDADLYNLNKRAESKVNSLAGESIESVQKDDRFSLWTAGNNRNDYVTPSQKSQDVVEERQIAASFNPAYTVNHSISQQPLQIKPYSNKDALQKNTYQNQYPINTYNPPKYQSIAPKYDSYGIYNTSETVNIHIDDGKSSPDFLLKLKDFNSPGTYDYASTAQPYQTSLITNKYESNNYSNFTSDYTSSYKNTFQNYSAKQYLKDYQPVSYSYESVDNSAPYSSNYQYQALGYTPVQNLISGNNFGNIGAPREVASEEELDKHLENNYVPSFNQTETAYSYDGPLKFANDHSLKYSRTQQLSPSPVPLSGSGYQTRYDPQLLADLNLAH